jgi:DNA repair protein RecN (Recombination protein N)
VLHELRIENLLLIERAELRLGEGLNAITGETGAGKTILAHSLDLLLGGRARPQIVRPGAGEAYVEGVFSLPEGLMADPELADLAERLPPEPAEIVLGRRIGASGRTSAFVQGRSASAADLRMLGPQLLAFYGQHEHRRLALASAQRDVLDGFAGTAHLERRRRYARAHVDAGRLERELSELREREGARERDLDLLRFELAEIEAAAPDPDEERELEEERERLRHAGRLREAAGGALAALDGIEEGGGGARGVVGEAEASLAVAGGVDRALDELAGRVGSLAVDMADAAASLRSYLDGVEAEPGRLEVVEERLDAIGRLKRKHGGSVEAVLEHAERCGEEIERLEGATELAEELERRMSEAAAERASLAGELSEARRVAGHELEARAAAELAELAMDGATLEVTLEPDPRGFGPGGREGVELRVATNPGLAPSLLGGAPGAPGTAPTMAFDEIDAGIGGNTARAVGERLRELGGERQVICITHLPQVACLAHTHFRISKRVAGGETIASVERLAGEDLVAEVCRMLGGDVADTAASRHARELLAAA